MSQASASASANIPLPWHRALWAGSVGALVSVAVVLTLGLLAFAPLGAAAAQVGIPAAFYTVIVSATVYALLARSPMPAGGPSSATALILASLLLQIVGSNPHPPDLPTLLIPLGLSVMVMGLLQCAMSRAGLGRLARFVPQPVLGGFMNGIALLILLAQVPPLLALPPGAWQAQDWPALAHGGPLALGAATAATVWLLVWRAPRAPAAPLGLLAGVLSYHGAQALWPDLNLGPVLAGTTHSPPPPGLLAALHAEPGAISAMLHRHARAIGLTGLLLALISTLETMLALRANDQQLGQHSDERRDLLALGLANLAGGALGALPMVLLRARSMAIVQAGGRGRRATLGAVAASVLMLATSGNWISLLPQAVLAGSMVTIAVSLIDPWSTRLLRRALIGDARQSLWSALTTVLLVCTLTVIWGPAAGVMAGVLLSMLVFVQRMNRSLVRARFDAAAQPSRRVYPPLAEALLHPQRHRVRVLELEGALFFGNAERLTQEAAALTGTSHTLIMDLRRVSAVDESGAMELRMLATQLARSGVRLVLAGASAAQRQRLHAFGVDDSAAGVRWARDTDHAVEAAELELLAEQGGGADALAEPTPLSACTLLRGLSPAQQDRVIGHMQLRTLHRGERLFSEGDPGDAVFVLVRGSISVLGATGQRFVSFSPGTMLGELALLDGRGRSAMAVADRDSEVWRLTRGALDALSATDAELRMLLYRNMALHLSERLRAASAAWLNAAA